MKDIVKKIFPWAIGSLNKETEMDTETENRKESNRENAEHSAESQAVNTAEMSVAASPSVPVQENDRGEEGDRNSGEPEQKEAPAVSEAPEKKPGRRPPRKRKRPSRDGKRSPQEAKRPPREAKTAPNDEPPDKAPDRKEREEKPPRIKLLINAEEPEECRIALLEDGRLESFHVNTVIREQTKGNIYKGRVAAIEPNLQAVFIDIGIGKNGFLPFSEIHPEYFHTDEDPPPHWRKLKIQEAINKGQEMLVQVVKEATGSKGANMTTYLSIPGRSLVLMPGSDSAGVSRKIEDETQRTSLRSMMDSFNIPEGIGYIIRTASKDTTKTVLSKDLRYLLRLWDDIKKRGQKMASPALIYRDQEIIVRFLRDHFSPDIDEILVDSQEAYDQVMNFMKLVPAKQCMAKIRLHRGDRPIFNHYDVEEQIEQIYQPEVRLPSGGSIVINPTEALVAVDVNSGRTSKDKDFNETIFLANMEAAAETARQLRLRDLGGLIVVDFIDMRNARHIREVEKQVKTSMKRDRAKVDISRISKFGLMQISRQKMGSPIQMDSYNVCSHCSGRGVVRSVETQALFCLRRIQTAVIKKGIKRVECRFPATVAQYLLNNKREELLELEKKHNVPIVVQTVQGMNPADHEINTVRE